MVSDTKNQMTLHTSSGCSMGVKRKETGNSLTTSCVNSTDNNAGCGVNAGSSTFGTTFNNNGGGIMAMELRSAGIRMWQFARSAIPSDITSGSPDPSTWGEAPADFPSTDCDIGTHFRNQSIIADIDLCGSWAGTQTVYAETCEPPPFASTGPTMSANWKQALELAKIRLRITRLHSRTRTGNSAHSPCTRLLDLACNEAYMVWI